MLFNNINRNLAVLSVHILFLTLVEFKSGRVGIALLNTDFEPSICVGNLYGFLKQNHQNSLFLVFLKVDVKESITVCYKEL
jgi:hypothetical protein